MTRVYWLTAYPRNIATGQIETVRLAGGGHHRPYDYQGHSWRAGIAGPPLYSASLGFGENGWTGQTAPSQARIVFAPAADGLLDELSGLFWKRARVTLEAGDEDDEAFPVELDGVVIDQSDEDGRLVLVIADRSEQLIEAADNNRFAGTGGIEGPDEATGRVKRRSWGYVFNVEGRLIDAPNSIYEFGDPAFPFTAWQALKDKGRDGAFTLVAWQGSIDATFAALQAASAAPGGGVAAPSIAMAKWWTEPAGPLTADIIGTGGTNGSMQVAALVDAISAEQDGPRVANVAAGNALRPAVAGIHSDNGSETSAQVIDRLTLGASLNWRVQPSGTIALNQWAFVDAGAEALKAKFIGRTAVFAPHHERRIRYRNIARSHSDSEIAVTLLEQDIEPTIVQGAQRANLGLAPDGAVNQDLPPSIIVGSDLVRGGGGGNLVDLMLDRVAGGIVGQTETTTAAPQDALNRFTDRVLEWVGTPGTLIEGNTLSKTLGFGNNAAIYSREASPAFFVSCSYDLDALTFGSNVGLSHLTAPTGTDLNEYRVYAQLNGSGNSIRLFVDGAGVANLAVSTGDIPPSGNLYLGVDGARAWLYVDGKLLASAFLANQAEPLRALVIPLFSGTSSRIEQVRYGFASNTLWSSQTGNGKPADNATANVALETFGNDIRLEANRFTNLVTRNNAGVRTINTRDRAGKLEFTISEQGLSATATLYNPASPPINSGTIGFFSINTFPSGDDLLVRRRVSGVHSFYQTVATLPNSGLGATIGLDYDGSAWIVEVNGAPVDTTHAPEGLSIKGSIIINPGFYPDTFAIDEIDWTASNDRSIGAVGRLGLAEIDVRNPVLTQDGFLTVTPPGGVPVNIGAVTISGLGFAGDLDAQRNSRITVNNGIMAGIGTPDVVVDNLLLMPSILDAAKRAEADLVTESEKRFWAVEADADNTANAVRTISPQFPMIEIREFEAGNIGDRVVGHVLRRGLTALTGGVWSLSSTLLGQGDATINANTGDVTFSDIAQSGSYTIRYRHTDNVVTVLTVNVTFVGQASSGGGGGGGTTGGTLTISSSPSVVQWYEGSTQSVIVTHIAREDSSTLSGGAWTLESHITGNVTVDAADGETQITNVQFGGSYTIRYMLADGRFIDKTVNIEYFPQGDPFSPNPQL